MKRLPEITAQPVSEVTLAQPGWNDPAMQSQIRDAVGRITWGCQTVRICINGGVPLAAIRAALIELGRDARRFPKRPWRFSRMESIMSWAAARRATAFPPERRCATGALRKGIA